MGVAHTHPGGNILPSSVDLAESRQAGLGVLCVTVPGSGRTACYDVGKGLVRLGDGLGKAERCILAVKEKLPAGCTEREWTKPVEARKSG